ncbi:uncharacterized protein LOC121385780 [Gigantopelta aegis]|uniref:uncharacterized protein LOC121385780 n=1 Tax=Gigantopelta aegis TaxID=1735272 RepID=UPI001B88D7CB|nr:uncharacterized protein LOC121385780 [Gigantopelta aegis]
MPVFTLFVVACYVLFVNSYGIQSINSQCQARTKDVTQDKEVGLTEIAGIQMPQNYVISLIAKLTEPKTNLQETSVLVKSRAINRLDSELASVSEMLTSALEQAGNDLYDLDTPRNTLEVMVLKVRNMKLEKCDEDPDVFERKVTSLSNDIVSVKGTITEIVSKLHMTKKCQATDTADDEQHERPS